MNKVNKVIVIINETHSLLPEQERILNQNFGTFEFLKVPAKGWTLKEMQNIASQLLESIIVFVSPVPVLLAQLAYMSGYAAEDNCISANGPLVGYGTQVYVFHNDKRVKKELPGGKIIQTVAPDGWQLIKIGGLSV